MPNPLPRQPTLDDLARSVGLSRSTVSAALLDDHRVSAKTRERVRQFAKKMGYVRNAFAATLATRGQSKPARSLDVAIVSHVPVDEGYEYYECEVIKNRLRELGYEGHHYDIVHDKISCEKLRAMLYHRGFCGVIFDQIYEEQSDMFSVDWGPFSLVCAGRTYRQPPCDLIRNNPIKAVSLAWEKLRQAGYRRIGFVLYSHQPVVLDDLEREGALWNCQRNLLPGEQAVPPCLGDFSNRAIFEEWFYRHRPDVVVGFNDLNYAWLDEMGLRVPQDIAYINLHGEDITGKVAGVDQRREELKIKTAEHLDFLIRHKRTGFSEEPWEMLGPVRWIPGESLPVRNEPNLSSRHAAR
jgi:LacI family transcriptional regulator